MIRQIQVGNTLCSDGIIISTVGFPGIGQQGGDYETAIRTLDSGRFEVIDQYDNLQNASLGHAAYVKLHGGKAGFFQKLALALELEDSKQ